MTRERISSGSPYEPIVGFSRAVRVGNRVFVSGTAPISPDGNVPEEVGDQARRCFEIIVAAIEQAGGTAADVVRTRTFLTSADNWEAVAKVHGEFFGETRPASTMVVVAALLDPAWKVEIEADALVGE